MNPAFQPAVPAFLRRSVGADGNALARLGTMALVGASLIVVLSAQTTVTIPIANASFENPTPTVFDDYTIGADGWTRTAANVNSGTFDPSVVPTTPLPIDGAQVGYADGFGGLQQALGDAFTANELYTFSVFIGYRTDTLDISDHGRGEISLGYLDADTGFFTLLASQSATVHRGDFDLVSGTFATTPAALDQTIVVRLTNLDSFQVLFDDVQLSATAIPEPSVWALGIGAIVLAAAVVLRRATGLSGRESP